MHTIPVSTGELLDKMSILQIKMDLLPPERKAHAKYEYQLIAIDIDDPQLQIYYQMLIDTNLKLWERQQEVHDGVGDPVEQYPEMLLLNDQRFKIKNQINQYTNSAIKEQKSYDEVRERQQS